MGWQAYRPGEPHYNQYRDPSVKAEAAAAKVAGMNYLVFTAKHHDGYPNFRTDNVRHSFYTDFAP
ncbi:alpha-L-fucosidase [Jiangella alba]|nr:alpha-L-fucosidase [Jiangella alba]